MRSRSIIRDILLAGGLIFGLAGQSASAVAALPANGAGASATLPIRFTPPDALSRPYGWQPFDITCSYGSDFAVSLERAKRIGERVVVRSFRITRSDVDGQWTRAAFGLDCAALGIDFD